MALFLKGKRYNFDGSPIDEMGNPASGAKLTPDEYAQAEAAGGIGRSQGQSSAPSSPQGAQPQAATPQAFDAPPSSGGGGAAPPASSPQSSSPAMASLMGGPIQPTAPDPMDVSAAGPSGLRQGLGQRNPPQYNYALASLGRGVY